MAIEQARIAAGHEPGACSGALTRAFAFLGKRWNGMVVGALGHGPAGFAELRRRVPGISESVLSDRLTEMGRLGVIAREVHEGPPLAVSYHLTEIGEALLPPLDQLAGWAEQHLPAGPCSTVQDTDEPC